MSAPLHERLDRFGDALTDCRRALEGRTPEDPAVTAAFERLQRDFAALGDLSSERASLVDEEDRERFDERLESLVCSHALLVGTLARDRERLIGELARAREARRTLRSTAAEGAEGRTCDWTA